MSNHATALAARSRAKEVSIRKVQSALRDGQCANKISCANKIIQLDIQNMRSSNRIWEMKLCVAALTCVIECE